MVYLTEFLIVVLLGYAVWRIFRQGLARNVLNVGIYFVGGVVSMAGYYLTDVLIPLCSSNLVARAAGALLVTGIGYAVTVFVLTRRYRSDEAPLFAALKKRIILPRWGERLACGALSLLLIMVVGLLLLFLVTIASACPPWRDAIAERSFYLRALSPSPKPAQRAPDGNGNVPRELTHIVDAQDGWLNRIRQRWTSARDTLADGTGSTAVLEQLEALREVTNLSPIEQAWLAERNPNIKKLLTHPRLQEIVEDDRLMGLVEGVGHGSVNALYALGDEPALRGFLEDEDVLRVVRSIDLLELQQQVQQRRRALGLRRPLCWSLATLHTTLELDEQLAKKSGWEYAGVTAVLSWPPDTKIGLARGGIQSADGAAHQVELQFQTSGQVTLLVDDRSIKLVERDGAVTAVVTLRPDRTAVVLMVHFPDPDAPRSCFAEAFVPATN